MAYRRGGVFRSRQIAPPSQRASVALSKPLVTQATLTFNAVAGNFTTAALDNEITTIGPLAVEAATGQERLVIVGGLTSSDGSAAVDFDACTVDGQVATRVGPVSRATAATSLNYVVVSGDSGCVTTVNFGATAFGTAAPSGFSAWGSGTTLNPADKKSGLVVLSNGNLTATGTDSGGNNWARSTTAQTGKLYVEFTATTVANTVVGIADQTAITFPGANAHSFGLFYNGFGSLNGAFPVWGNTYASGNVVGMAVDLTAKKVWWRINGGVWNGSALNDPATGVGGLDIATYAASAATTFVTAYRAPGTSNTSINVALTANNVAGATISNAYAACFAMNYTGTLRASVNGTSNDPTLSAVTFAGGNAVAGLYGTSTTAFAAPSTTPVFRSMDSTVYVGRIDTTITKPTGVVDGDILLATIFVGEFGLIADVVTPPAGWTQIGTTVTTLTDGNYFANFYAFWHRASSDGASYTFSHALHGAQGAITAYSGCVASGNPIDVFSQNTSASATLIATGITTTSSNTKLVMLAHNWDGTGTLTPPTGMTERLDAAGGVAYIADEDFATAGATGDRTQTLASNNPWSAFLVALKPVAGGGGGLATAWTGLTERVDVATAPVTFSVASENILVTSSPLAISADITPNLTGGTDAVASLSLTFNPIPLRTVPAISGSYVMTGTAAATVVGRKVVAAPSSYAMTGTAATLHNVQHLAAAAGSYAMTGINANINPSAGATASIVFDATDTDVTALSSGTYTFPLTVAPASGERLVVVGGIAGTDGDFSAVTIGGNAATRVGFVSRGVADSSGYTPFLTAYRAPGSASTSINVVATIGGSLKTWTAAYCAGFSMSGTGTVYAATNANSNDPTLSTDVVNKGAVVAALLGYADAVTPPTVAWTGLTERFDAVRALSSDVFSGASIDVSAAAVPVFRSVSNTPYAQRTSTSIDTPVGVVDGDILIAGIFIGNATSPGDITAPAGWTQIGTNTVVGDPFFVADFYVFWKRAASEAAFSTFSHSGGENATSQGVMAAYSGCITSGDPVDVFSVNSANTGSLATATGVTTTVASTKLVYAAHNWDGTGTLVPPTGMTERFDSIAYLSDADFAGPGATGDFTQVLASSNFPWSAFLVALKPATSPRAINADITPNLTDVGTDSVASLCISFLPGGTAGSSLIAAPGTYAMTGLAALTRRGFRTAAATIGSYAMTGTPASGRALGRIGATAGSYAMTGSLVATVKGGAAKAALALPGSYAMTGTPATMHRGVKVPVTTVGSYNMTGTSPVSTGMGLIAVAGSYAMTGTAATPVKRAGSNISIGVGSSAMTASSGTAVVHTTVGVSVSGAGNVATVSVGNPTVLFSGGVSVLVSSPGMTASVGTVAVGISGGIEVSIVTGFEMTASVGNETVLIPARVTVTGNFMTASAGTVVVNVLGSANMLVFGNQLDASVGTVTFSTNANIPVTGNEMAASVGSVDAFSLVGAVVTGNEMTASVGGVTVTAKQNTVVEVQGNALVAFVGTLDFAGGGTITHPNLKNREGRMLQPSNWMGA